MAEPGFTSRGETPNRFDYLPDGWLVSDVPLQPGEHAVVISSDGARRVGWQDVRADALRLKPKLRTDSVRHIIDTAHFRWSLGGKNA